MSEEGKDKQPTEQEIKMTPPQPSGAAILEKSVQTEQPSVGMPKQPPVNMGSSVRYSWPLARNVTAEVTITGPSISSNDLEMLRKYLELAKTALGDSTEQKG